MEPHDHDFMLAITVITLAYLILAGYVIHRTPPERIPVVLVRLASMLLVLPVMLYGPDALRLIHSR
jgi:hypothetical protein